MRNFSRALKTTLLFLLVFALSSVAVMEFYFQGENYFYQDARERRAAAGTIDTLFIGSSHTQRSFKCSVADEKLGICSYNLGGSNADMQARVELLKEELVRNPVKNVILDLSYETFRQGHEDEHFEGDVYTMARMDNWGERLSYMAQCMRASQLPRTFSFFLQNGFDCMKLALQGKYSTVTIIPSFDKGFQYNDDTPNKDLTANFNYKKKYNTKGTDEIRISQESMGYFEEFVQICRENDIDLLLVNTVVSKQYICKHYDLDDVRTFYQELAGENDLVYLDFSLLKDRDELFNDATDFRDADHLWHEAADRFTEKFSEIYAMYRNGEDTSDLFFDSYEAYEMTQDYYPDEK